MIAIRALGPIEVLVDDRPAPSELLWRKNLALLVYLARSPKRTRTRDHLIGLLWADKVEKAARHSLNVALGTLRDSTGEAGIVTEVDRVRLAEGIVTLDADGLEAHAAAGRWSQAAQLALGEFLEGFSVPDASDFETWLGTEREHWRRRSVEVLIAEADARFAAGDLPRGLELAERACGLAPTAELAVRTVMRGLALAGERGSALERYTGFVARLADQLGTEPDAETRALADRVRREREWRRPAAAHPPRQAVKAAIERGAADGIVYHRHATALGQPLHLRGEVFLLVEDHVVGPGLARQGGLGLRGHGA